MTDIQRTREQFYLFPMADDMCPVWVEYFGADGKHYVAPMPLTDENDALSWLKRQYPDATVDTLYLGDDIREVQHWARTMPLEQIG